MTERSQLQASVGVSAPQQEDDCRTIEREKKMEGGGGGGGYICRDQSVSQTL